MLRVASHSQLSLTEFEEEIIFDSDDPDFHRSSSLHNMLIRVASTMSLASVHPAELHSSHSSLATLSHSMDDIANWNSPTMDNHVLTIEELRDHLNCCFTCGVSWADDHVSLDCPECAGYALQRPCPTCDGSCGAVWKRDLSLSHAGGKAKWSGECLKTCSQQQKRDTFAVSQDLSKRFERLSANS